MFLLVCVRTSCAMRGEVLSGLLWHQRHGVAELFEAVDMVTLDTSPIPLVKVISSQIAIGYTKGFWRHYPLLSFIDFWSHLFFSQKPFRMKTDTTCV